MSARGTVDADTTYHAEPAWWSGNVTAAAGISLHTRAIPVGIGTPTATCFVSEKRLHFSGATLSYGYHVCQASYQDEHNGTRHAGDDQGYCTNDVNTDVRQVSYKLETGCGRTYAHRHESAIESFPRTQVGAKWWVKLLITQLRRNQCRQTPLNTFATAERSECEG